MNKEVYAVVKKTLNSAVSGVELSAMALWFCIIWKGLISKTDKMEWYDYIVLYSLIIGYGLYQLWRNCKFNKTIDDEWLEEE